jgi:hypothetical protein
LKRELVIILLVKITAENKFNTVKAGTQTVAERFSFTVEPSSKTPVSRRFLVSVRLPVCWRFLVPFWRRFHDGFYCLFDAGSVPVPSAGYHLVLRRLTA